MLRNLICLLSLSNIVFWSIEMIVFSVVKKENSQNKYISSSKGLHYFCSVLTIVINLALFLNIMDYDNSFLWFYVLFTIASVLSVLIMLWVVFWKIEYNDNELIYRNIFGKKQKYDINNISLKSKNDTTTVMYKNKKVTNYNLMMVNIFSLIEFETFIETKTLA